MHYGQPSGFLGMTDRALREVVGSVARNPEESAGPPVIPCRVRE
jgi:hypothetical protein